MSTSLPTCLPRMLLRRCHFPGGPSHAMPAPTLRPTHLGSHRMHADRRYQALQGIVVRDTQNTLQLVTPDNRYVVVPKQVGRDASQRGGCSVEWHRD